jgi:hypothetical protein
MTLPGVTTRAPRNAARLALVAIFSAALVLGLGAQPSLVAAAVAGPKVAVIVGPSGTETATNRLRANAVATEAAKYTSNVVRVYSPNATWERVKSAISGASIVVYFGRGRGFPSPYSTSLQPTSQDGFGLNPVAGQGDVTTRWYGESSIRTVHLQWPALVLLHPLAYASGNSEPGRAAPTLTVARRRVDNYGAGFLAVGAAAVIAETNRAVGVRYVQQVFTTNATLDAIWRSAATNHGHITPFTSSRTSGAYGRTDPVGSTWGYTRSIVGRLATTTTAVRGATATSATVQRVSGPIVVTTSNVTIDGVSITSSGMSGAGIQATGTAANPIRNLTIRNCTIKGFRFGILMRHVQNLVIQNCRITDADYAGIGIYSGVGGRISGNIVQRIGMTRTNLSEPGIENNAYGITLDRNAWGSFTTDPRSSDFVIDHNLVEDVPLWMCMNTHAGARLTFSDNTTRRCPRAIFIAGDSGPYTNHPIDVTVTRNRLEQAVTKTGGTTSKIGVLTAGLQGGSITNNAISSTFSAPVYDYAGEGNGASVNVTISGTTIIP